MVAFPNRQFALGWLAGIIDGEGSVSDRHKVVKVANTDPNIIAATKSVLGMLHVPFWTQTRFYDNEKWKPITNVLIHGKRNFEILTNRLVLQSEQKRGALKRLPSLYKPVRQVDAKLLRRLYITERKSQKTIAVMLGWKPHNVQYACRRLGLKISGSERLRRGWSDERRVRQSASMRAAWVRRRQST